MQGWEDGLCLQAISSQGGKCRHRHAPQNPTGATVKLGQTRVITAMLPPHSLPSASLASFISLHLVSKIILYNWLVDLCVASLYQGFPGGSAGKEPTCNAGALSSIPGLGRSPGERKGYPYQYPGLENSLDCIVHEVAKSRTRLNHFHFIEK